MKPERWAVCAVEGFSRTYQGFAYSWTRKLSRIKWYATRAEAERSFDHSMWVPVRESDVLVDLTADALTGEVPLDAHVWPK